MQLSWPTFSLAALAWFSGIDRLGSATLGLNLQGTNLGVLRVSARSWSYAMKSEANVCVAHNPATKAQTLRRRVFSAPNGTAGAGSRKDILSDSAPEAEARVGLFHSASQGKRLSSTDRSFFLVGDSAAGKRPCVATQSRSRT